MFFILSKILWIIASPTNVAVMALIVGFALGIRRPRAGRHLVGLATATLLVCGFLPVGTLMLRPLEDRFPVPDLTSMQPKGIIVLGGAIDQVVGAARGQVTIAGAGTRITAAAVLARRFPEARLVYTGGSNSLLEQVGGEAEDAKRLFVDLGIGSDRILVETRSRNTDENARFSRDLLHPDPKDCWLLVTSAYHMPRSVGLFRAAGFHVIPYPVDYRTTATWRDWQPYRDASEGLASFGLASREWIGLLAYRLSGKTREFLPGP